jgi:hypothetical protein
MAYLDVRGPIASAPVPSAIEAVAGFARREWDVIVLAQKDGLGSLYEPSRFSRVMSWLFGGSASRRLADPKLETLRRRGTMAMPCRCRR